MPLYEFCCDCCKEVFETMVPLQQRNNKAICPVCNGASSRVFTSPTVFMERAGCVDGRPDEFWERADRHKETQLKKRTSAEKEALRYGDKGVRSKLETAHANLSRQGEHEKAESVARQLDAK